MFQGRALHSAPAAKAPSSKKPRLVVRKTGELSLTWRWCRRRATNACSGVGVVATAGTGVNGMGSFEKTCRLAGWLNRSVLALTRPIPEKKPVLGMLPGTDRLEGPPLYQGLFWRLVRAGISPTRAC